ncbi:MAG: DoxX family protein [Actinomycetota bacterium]
MADGDIDRSRLLLPALGPVYQALSQASWPLVRFICGAALVPHGWGKLIEGGLPGTADAFAKLGIEPAYPLALYIGLLELVGGTLLALGLFTRLVAVQVVVFMATAVVQVHWPNGYAWTGKGYEYPLFWGMVALAIAFRGGGRWSVDRLLPWEF